MAKKAEIIAEGPIVEKVKIFAINKKYKEKPFLVTAVINAQTGEYITGQEHLTKTQRASSELVIVPEENYMIRHNDELRLKRTGDKYELNRDYAIYCLLQVVPEIAKTRTEATSSRHLFYLENYEKEAEQVVSVSKLRAKAYALVADKVSLEDMADILFYFGAAPSNMTQTRAEARIYELVEERAEDVIEYFTNATKARKLVFIRKLIHYGVLSKQRDGYIYYNDQLLGATEEEAGNTVFEKDNDKVYQALQDQLRKALA